jgi:surface antigen-like variable number repeat protein
VAFLILTIPQIPSQVDHTEYYVHRGTFIGSLSGVTDKNLREASTSIEEGKTYSPKGLDRAIMRINKLGTFRKITRADCRVTRSNPGTVDIEIRLNIKTAAGSSQMK